MAEVKINRDKSDKEIVEKRKAKPVVGSPATKQKKTLGTKIKELFFNDDTIDVKEYVINEVIIPTIRFTLSDIILGNFRGGSVYNRGRTDYGAYSKRSVYSYGQRPKPPENREPEQPREGFENAIFATRQEAQDALDDLKGRIEEFGSASVGDLYDMAMISGDFTDYYKGWYNLDRSFVKRVMGGFVIDLPRPVLFKN